MWIIKSQYNFIPFTQVQTLPQPISLLTLQFEFSM